MHDEVHGRAASGHDGQRPPSAAEPAAAHPLAEELAAIRRRVLNVIGHELRTPVTTLRGLAEEVCEADDLAQVTDELGPALLRSTRRLEALLDDLLVAAGIQTAIPVAGTRPVPVAAAARQAWAAISGDALAVSGDAAVLAPTEVLERILGAVLDNAAAYGTEPPQVDVTADGDAVVVAVRSPGPPLHPEEVRLATEPFFRGERAVTTRPGLGVGLAIARELAAHLGGGVHLEGDADGCTTAVRLPKAPGAPEALR